MNQTKKQKNYTDRILNRKMKISDQKTQDRIDNEWVKTFEKISPTGVVGKTFSKPSALKRKKHTF